MLLVLDNYDSFTWNLVQYLGELGADPVVRRNDEVTVAEVAAMAPDHIVISPGPCTPREAGISVACVQTLGARIPILGVCLGHQAIGAAYGARVERGGRLMHGKVSPIVHTGQAMFHGLNSPLQATRYHSLVISRDGLPGTLEILAWTGEEGWEHEIQAVRHREQPVWGVQFHPESFASEAGHTILRNFLALQCAPATS